MSDRSIKNFCVAIALCFILTGLFHENSRIVRQVFGSAPTKTTKFLQEKVPFLWTAAVLAVVLAVRWRPETRVPRGGWIALGAGLAGLATANVVSHWHLAKMQGDSSSYVVDFARPPAYPLFLKVIQGSEEFSQVERNGTAEPNGLENPNPSVAALRSVRVQKVLFWASWVFLTLSLAWVSGRAFALSACFCVVLYRFNWLGTGMVDYLMSEALASAMLHLLLGFAILAGATRSAWWLPPAALAFAVAVLARTAAGFGIVFLVVAGIAVVAAHWRRPGYLLGPLALVAAIGVGSLYYGYQHCYERNGYYGLSPLSPHELVAFALEVADDADAEHFADPHLRKFFVLAREIRDSRRRELGWENRPIEEMELNLNCWQAACPAIHQVFKEAKGPDHPVDKSFNVFAVDAFSKTADIILPLHRDRRLAIYKRFVGDCLFHLTRLHYKYESRSGRYLSIPFPIFLGLAVAGCSIGRNLAAVASLACLGAFALFILGMCLYEQPLGRYLEFVEWVGLLGFYLAGLSAVNRVWQWREGRRGSKTPELAGSESGTPANGLAA